MRHVNQFTAGEWLRLQPLQQGLKQLRNDALLARYLGVRPPALDAFLAANQSLAGRPVALVIAFEQTWTLDWLLAAAARQLPGVTVLVADNSRQQPTRDEVAAVCARHGAPYFGLPPYRTRHANRSHGMAMSWVFHHLVRGLRPGLFAFLDHDLIPVAPVDFAERLGAQPVFGLPNEGRFGCWSLWAGYCMYRLDAVAARPLNFLYDFSRGLDTGGRNWNPLYSTLDRGALRFASRDLVELQPSAAEPPRPVELIDGRWIHVGGVSYNDNTRVKAGFFNAVRAALDAGTPFEALRHTGLQAASPSAQSRLSGR
jgi:hypothetical protein